MDMDMHMHAHARMPPAVGPPCAGIGTHRTAHGPTPPFLPCAPAHPGGTGNALRAHARQRRLGRRVSRACMRRKEVWRSDSSLLRLVASCHAHLLPRPLGLGLSRSHGGLRRAVSSAACLRRHTAPRCRSATSETSASWRQKRCALLANRACVRRRRARQRVWRPRIRRRRARRCVSATPTRSRCRC